MCLCLCKCVHRPCSRPTIKMISRMLYNYMSCFIDSSIRHVSQGITSRLRLSLDLRTFQNASQPPPPSIPPPHFITRCEHTHTHTYLLTQQTHTPTQTYTKTKTKTTHTYLNLNKHKQKQTHTIGHKHTCKRTHTRTQTLRTHEVCKAFMLTYPRPLYRHTSLHTAINIPLTQDTRGHKLMDKRKRGTKKKNNKKKIDRKKMHI